MADLTWKTEEELEIERNKLSQIQELEKSQADLIFELMMGGVI
jgi:hypothetical protein